MDRSPGRCRYFISNCDFTASIQQDVHRFFFLRYSFWIAREKAQVVSAWKMYVLGWSKTWSSQIIFFTTQESCGRCFVKCLGKHIDGCGPFKTTRIVDVRTFLASEKFKSGLFFVLFCAAICKGAAQWLLLVQSVTSHFARGTLQCPTIFHLSLKSASSEEKALAPLFSLPLMWQYHPAVINPLWLQRTHWTP